MRNLFFKYLCFFVLFIVFQNVKCYSFERYNPIIDDDDVEEPKPSSTPIPIDIKRLPVNPHALSPFSRRKNNYYDKDKRESHLFERLRQGGGGDSNEKCKASSPIPIEIRRQPVHPNFLRPCSYGKNNMYENQRYRRLRRRINSKVRKIRESTKQAYQSRGFKGGKTKNVVAPRSISMRWKA